MNVSLRKKRYITINSYEENKCTDDFITYQPEMPSAIESAVAIMQEELASLKQIVTTALKTF